MTVKIAIPYKHDINFSLNDKVKEFNILFFKSKNKLEKLIDFIDAYPETRINIKFPEGIHIATLNAVNKITDNVYVRLRAQDIPEVEELKKNNIKFFFDADCPAYNYSTLDSFINLGVTDVYLADDLCYNMSDISEYIHEKNIQLRLVLNRIPSTTLDRGINVRSSIYMPKDFEKLNKYYDVFEFECGEPCDWVKFDVLYRAWFERQYWHGQMSEINDDVFQDFHCDAIYPDFTEFKLNCERRCGKRLANPCRKCEQWLAIGETLKKKNVRFKD
jgi:hypothetical protein